MSCFIEHENYKEFSNIYGNEGVDYIYSQLLDIPTLEDTESLDKDIIKRLNRFKILNTKREIFSSLKEIFGDDLKDSDIKFITNLGSSIAKFKASGEILFNNLELQNRGVEYHEAFHRIFRMYIEDSERKQIYDEVRRLNPDKPWTKYTQYKTEEDQIEELIADDFMVYAVNKNYKDKSMLGKLFFRILKFIKAVFSRPDRLNKIYDKILNGGYQGNFSKTPLLSDANKFIMDYTNAKEPDVTHNFELSLEDKDSVIDELVKSLVDTLFDSNNNLDPYKFVSGELNLEEVFNQMFKKLFLNKNLSADLKAVMKYNFFNKKNQLAKEFYDRLATYRIKITEAEEDEVEKEDGVGDRGFDIPAQQFDPIDSISKVIRLKLSTIEDTRPDKTRSSINDNLGESTFTTYTRFGEVWKTTSKILAYTPPYIDEMIYALKISDQIPQFMKDSLVTDLNTYKETNPGFVTDFVSSFNKSNYNYGRAIVVDGKIEYKEITFGLAQSKALVAISNTISEDPVYKEDEQPIEKINRFLPASQKALVTEDIEQLNRFLQSKRFTSKEVRTALLSVSTGRQLETIDKKLSAIRINEIVKLKNYLVSYAKTLVSEEGIQETMHLTIKGKPIYDISFDTTLSKSFKVLRFIQNINSEVFTKYPLFSELQENTIEFKTNIEGIGFEAALTLLNNKKLGYTKLVLLNYYLPHLLTNYMFTNKNGVIQANSDMLNKMFGENITSHLTVTDGIEELLSGSKENSELGELSSAELNIYYITNLYNDVYDTIKHSDRSTFFTVLFKDSKDKKVTLFDKLDKQSGIDNMISYTADNLLNRLLVAEKSYYRSTIDSTIRNQNKYFIKGKMRNAFSDMLEGDDLKKSAKLNKLIEDYFNDKVTLTKKDKKELKASIERWLKDNIQDWKDKLKSDGVLNRENKIDDIYRDFIPKEIDLNTLLTYSFSNAILWHMEEQMLLYSHFNQYKDSDDLYKRMNTHSGTGRSFDMSISTNREIALEFSLSPFTIVDLDTGKTKELYNTKYEDKEFVDDNITPTIIQTTFNEFQKYSTRDKKKFESDIRESLKALKHSLIAEGMTEKQAQVAVDDRLKLYTDKDGNGTYDKMNMPDGQSYITIFFIKEYKKRLKEWTDNHEILFQAELEVLAIDTRGKSNLELQKESLQIIKNAYKNIMIVENNKINSYNKEIFKSNEEIREYNKIDPKKQKKLKETKKLLTLQETFKQYLHSFEVLKPQYGGPTTLTRDHLLEEDFNKQIYSYSVNKTSFMALVPSIIIGTGLHHLNNILLENNIDVAAMQSATKLGNIDYVEFGIQTEKKLEDENYDYKKEFGVDSIEQMKDIVSKLKSQGLEVYDDNGKFNPITKHVFKASKQYLSWMYLKDQVKIHDHPKESITNSTQSMKNVLANLYVYLNEVNIPIDALIKGISTDRWSKMTEEERLDESDLYKDITEYHNSINSLIEHELKTLLDKIGYEDEVITNFKKFGNLLITSAKDRNSANNVIEALNLFIDSTPRILDTMSNKNKIEPIIYSLLSKVINFKRPGNSVPMVASQLLERYNTGKTSREQVSDVLKSYSLENGKLKPAEIIYPLPRHWFNKVIKAVNNHHNIKLDNIFDALPLFNEMLANGEREIIVKGVRIPNQQYSSNDILKIKEFKLPTLESFVFVYPEIVAKTGGDFDIDKLNMFFYEYDDNFMPIMTEEQIDKERVKEYRKEARERISKENFYPESEVTEDDIDLYISNFMTESVVKAHLYNRILDAEINIFRNSYNYWQMMMPISDDYLKGDLLSFMKDKVKEWEAKYKDVKYIKDDKSSYSQVLTPKLNAIKTILYLQGKAAIGIIAPQGTGHSIAGKTTMEINPKYTSSLVFDLADKSAKSIEKVKVFSSLPLPKEFYNTHLSSMITKDGQIITEVISQMLNSQLDIGKDPYPATMGLLLENINFICYAVRRGVPLEIILQIVQHPEIKKFTQYRAKYESVLSKANKNDPGRNKVIQEYLEQELYETNPDLAKLIKSKSPKANGIHSISRVDESVQIKIKPKTGKFYELDDSTVIKDGKVDETNKMNILLGYMQIMEQSRTYGDFVRYSTFDTKTFKDKAQYDTWRKLEVKIREEQFFSNKSIDNFDNTSLIAVFKKLKDHYAIFDNLHYDTLTKGAVKELLQYFKFRNTQEKERFQNTLSASLITYMIQKELPRILKENDILLGDEIHNLNKDNLPLIINRYITEIKNYFEPFDKNGNRTKSNNYFYNSFNIVLNYSKKQHAMFTKDRVRNTQEINNMLQDLERVKENNEDIYNKILILPFLTTGLANGRYNFQDTLAQELRYKIVFDSLKSNLNIEQIDKLNFLKAFVIKNKNTIKSQSEYSKKTIGRVYPKRSEYSDSVREPFIFFPPELGINEIELKSIEDDKITANYAQPVGQPILPQLPVGQKQPISDLKSLENNALAIIKSNTGDDKFIYLRSQKNQFKDAIILDDKDGKRLKGKNYKGIGIVADYYSSKTIKDRSGKDMADILFVDSKEQAQQQYDNYLKGGSQQFTKIVFNDLQKGLEPINIYYGSGDNVKLSNFAKREFTYKERTYQSIEHAYQTLKSGTFNEEVYSRPNDFIGTKKNAPKNVNKDISLYLMKDLIGTSFEQNKSAKQELLNTNDSKLTHFGGTDKFWESNFPKLLMEVRSELKKDNIVSKPEIAESMQVFYKLKDAKEELEANKAEFKTETSLGITKIYNMKNKLIATYNSLGQLATTAHLKDVTIDDMAKDLHDLACS